MKCRQLPFHKIQCNNQVFCEFTELTKVGSKVEERLETLGKILEEDKKREKELEVC